MIMLTSGTSPGASGCATRRIASQLTKPVKQSDLLDAIVTAFGEPVERAAAERERPSHRSHGRRRLHILVAEDNATNQTLIRLCSSSVGIA